MYHAHRGISGISSVCLLSPRPPGASHANGRARYTTNSSVDIIITFSPSPPILPPPYDFLVHPYEKAQLPRALLHFYVLASWFRILSTRDCIFYVIISESAIISGRHPDSSLVALYHHRTSVIVFLVLPHTISHVDDSVSIIQLVSIPRLLHIL